MEQISDRAREKKSKTSRATNEVVWRKLPGSVTHTFTHFPLELIVYTASIKRMANPPAGARWIPACKLAGEALPSVMRKVIAHAVEYEDRQDASFNAGDRSGSPHDHGRDR